MTREKNVYQLSEDMLPPCVCALSIPRSASLVFVHCSHTFLLPPAEKSSFLLRNEYSADLTATSSSPGSNIRGTGSAALTAATPPHHATYRGVSCCCCCCCCQKSSPLCAAFSRKVLREGTKRRRYKHKNPCLGPFSTGILWCLLS